MPRYTFPPGKPFFQPFERDCALVWRTLSLLPGLASLKVKILTPVAVIHEWMNRDNVILQSKEQVTASQIFGEIYIPWLRRVDDKLKEDLPCKLIKHHAFLDVSATLGWGI